MANSDASHTGCTWHYEWQWLHASSPHNAAPLLKGVGTAHQLHQSCSERLSEDKPYMHVDAAKRESAMDAGRPKEEKRVPCGPHGAMKSRLSPATPSFPLHDPPVFNHVSPRRRPHPSSFNPSAPTDTLIADADDESLACSR